MTVFVVALWVALVGAVVAGVRGWQLFHAERIETTRLREAFERSHLFAAEKETWLRDGLRDQAARHERDLDRMRETQAAALDAAKQAITSALYGGPTRAARVIPQQPDAEMRGLRKIREETIQAGMRAIKADYDAQGIPIADEELRLQALAFIDGEPERAFDADGATPTAYGRDG